MQLRITIQYIVYRKREILSSICGGSRLQFSMQYYLIWAEKIRFVQNDEWRAVPAAYLLKARSRSQFQFTKYTLLFAAFAP